MFDVILFETKVNIRRNIGMLYWDWVKTNEIIRILPVIIYHKEKGLLEFGWLNRAFLILVDESKLE